MSSIRFADRRDAGRRLAGLVATRDLHDPVVLALPRGGVPVAREVADVLAAPLDLLVVRKIGAPGRPEYGVGAIGEGGVELLDGAALARLGLARDDLVATIEHEREVLRERVRRYRGDTAALDLHGRDCVVVDDGIATGVSAAAAVTLLRRREPARIVLAVPVAAPSGATRLEPLVDDLVVLASPRRFLAVGEFYDDFAQTSDDEVRALLASPPRAAGGDDGPVSGR